MHVQTAKDTYQDTACSQMVQFVLIPWWCIGRPWQDWKYIEVWVLVFAHVMLIILQSAVSKDDKRHFVPVHNNK